MYKKVFIILISLILLVLISSSILALMDKVEMKNSLKEIEEAEINQIAALNKNFNEYIVFENFNNLHSSYMRNWISKKEMVTELVNNLSEEQLQNPMVFENLALLISSIDLDKIQIQGLYEMHNINKQCYNKRLIVILFDMKEV